MRNEIVLIGQSTTKVFLVSIFIIAKGVRLNNAKAIWITLNLAMSQHRSNPGKKRIWLKYFAEAFRLQYSAANLSSKSSIKVLGIDSYQSQ